jgi:hypothetical protein
MTTLPCPRCGQELTIPAGVITLACGSRYCRLSVLQTGGIVVLEAAEPAKVDLEKIFLNLTKGGMETLIMRYSTYENSKSLPWLIKVRDLRKDLAALKTQKG